MSDGRSLSVSKGSLNVFLVYLTTTFPCLYVSYGLSPLSSSIHPFHTTIIIKKKKNNQEPVTYLPPKQCFFWGVGFSCYLSDRQNKLMDHFSYRK